MNKVKLIIESQSDDGVVHAVVNGVKYIYSGMDSAIFKVRRKTYKYKPGQLLNWLKKNSQRVEKVEPVKHKSTRTNVTRVTERVTPAQRVIMMEATKQLMKSFEYTPIMKGTTIEPKRCPRCNKMSLMGCYSKDKKAVIGICMHRFDPITGRVCWFNKRWDIDKGPNFITNTV